MKVPGDGRVMIVDTLEEQELSRKLGFREN